MKRKKNSAKKEEEPSKDALNNLLKFREKEIEDALKLGQIAIDVTDEYRRLATKLGKDNPLANDLPLFTSDLLNQFGSHGSIENALKNELLNNKPKPDIDKKEDF